MINLFEKLKQWWDEQPTIEQEIQTFHDMQAQARQNKFAQYEQMSERELLIEIAKNIYDL